MNAGGWLTVLVVLFFGLAVPVVWSQVQPLDPSRLGGWSGRASVPAAPMFGVRGSW